MKLTSKCVDIAILITFDIQAKEKFIPDRISGFCCQLEGEKEERRQTLGNNKTSKTRIITEREREEVRVRRKKIKSLLNCRKWISRCTLKQIGRTCFWVSFILLVAAFGGSELLRGISC